MVFTSSDYVASLAILVSSASAYYTKRQSELSNIASNNDYRAHLSDHHEKYRIIVKEIEGQYRVDLETLVKLAGTTLSAITDIFDEHDTNRRSIRPLRHLIHESSEMVYYAFKGQLAWNSGSSISYRFAQISRIEDRLDPQSDQFSGGDFRRAFERAYHNDPEFQLEIELQQDIHFCKLVNQMRERIDPQKKGDFLKSVQEKYLDFRNLLIALQPQFGDGSIVLERALEENEMEHFPLSESPRLYRKLKRIKSRLSILNNFDTMKIDNENIDKYQNYISICIYICAMLFAIQDVRSWGWRND
ncbi:hypothetical protein [Glaciimonas soli]|uniref:Uncharacterized protein n=1 Tax=Glaciimonas soli TaxID=2590999 RepID=A0A843YNV9_9BURK|nr:hypothetical protein [Glaciimonas soli]MQR00670.1 hypothetical protein [Glaciimonas soli]